MQVGAPSVPYDQQLENIERLRTLQLDIQTFQNRIKQLEEEKERLEQDKKKLANDLSSSKARMKHWLA